MAQIFRVKMTTTVSFDLKADKEEQAKRWLEMHSFEDVFAQTRRYDIDETSEIEYMYGKNYDDEDIDISTEEE